MKKKRSSPKKVLITAGPTIEPLDPVRYLSNHSTGVMGYALAREALKRGFRVKLITGPVEQTPPGGAQVVKVTTSGQMRDKVKSSIRGCSALVMAAAVCDFRPARRRPHKIKKHGHFSVSLVKTPDILLGLKKKRGIVKAGFALESRNAAGNALKKLKAKDLDFIVVNTIDAGHDPFGPGRKTYTIINRRGDKRRFRGVTKARMAKVIIGEISGLLCGQ